MSWEKMERCYGSGHLEGVSVALRANRITVNFGEPVAAALKWEHGTRVDCFRGRGEHAGLVRFQASQRGRKLVRHARGRMLLLTMPRWSGIREEKANAVLVEHKFLAGETPAVEVTLPSWGVVKMGPRDIGLARSV